LDLGVGSALYLGCAAVVTAVLHSLGGFAGALMLAVGIAPVVGVKATVPIVSVAMIVSHSSRAWLFRNGIHWPIYLTIVAAGLPGIVTGALLYVELPERIIAVGLGIFLLAMIALRRVLRGWKVSVGRPTIATVAVAWGFISGTTFGAGLMLGPFLLGAGLTGEVLLGTVAMLGFSLNVFKTLVFGLSPLLTGELALIGFGLGVATIPGHRLGRWIVRRTPVRIHTLFLEAFMVLGSFYFIAKGIGIA
jgi:uncharacterized membrane protein YfcA